MKEDSGITGSGRISATPPVEDSRPWRLPCPLATCHWPLPHISLSHFRIPSASVIVPKLTRRLRDSTPCPQTRLIQATPCIFRKCPDEPSCLPRNISSQMPLSLLDRSP